jgi:hypothetical protein
MQKEERKEADHRSYYNIANRLLEREREKERGQERKREREREMKLLTEGM